MSSQERVITEKMDDARERAIFQLIVTLQDQGLDVRRSREQVAKQESITVEEVQQIERLGLANNWPPLE